MENKSHELGVFLGEPEDVYHAAIEFVSSSPLASMNQSPMHFRHRWQTTVEETDAMRQGTFIHRIGLEQDIACYVKRPLTEKGSLVASNTKEYKAWEAELKPGQRPIHPDKYMDAEQIFNSFANNRTFVSMFDAADVEVSYYAKDPLTGTKIKARTDLIAKDRSWILDVKSTADIAKFERDAFYRNYDTRLMHYAQCVEAVEGHEINDFYFLAIESAAPYGTKLFKLDTLAVSNAKSQWRQWMNVISACIADDAWPGYTEDIKVLSRPAFLPGFEAVEF